MQDVISSRKLNKYRSPELGRSTFEEKKNLSKLDGPVQENKMQSKTVLNLLFTGLYWKDSSSKLSMGAERTKTG